MHGIHGRRGARLEMRDWAPLQIMFSTRNQAAQCFQDGAAWLCMRLWETCRQDSAALLQAVPPSMFPICIERKGVGQREGKRRDGGSGQEEEAMSLGSVEQWGSCLVFKMSQSLMYIQLSIECASSVESPSPTYLSGTTKCSSS